MRTYKKWTEEDIKFLRSEIEKSPYNLTAAFTIVAEKRQVSVCAVKQHYYNHRKDKYNGTFTLISKKRTVPNYKNITKDKINSTNSINIISDVISYIKSFFKL